MKKKQSFCTAFIMSLIMIVWSNVSTLLIKDQGDLLTGTGCLILLQIVLVMKYVSGTLVVMPGSIHLIQVISGFLCSDIFIGLPLSYSKAGLSFTAEILIAQLALVTFYFLAERRPAGKMETPTVWNPTHELYFQGI